MTYTDFLALWTEGTDPELAALKAGGVKAIRAKTGLSQQRFGDAFGIPKRTVQNWESDIPANHNDVPAYTLALLAYAVLYGDKARNN